MILTVESGLTRYYEQIRRFPLLERQDEYMFAQRWRNGDREAAHRLVTSHLRLVAKIAMGYPSVPQGQELFVFAKRHRIFDTMNRPFSPLIICKASQKIEKIAGLLVTVISPAAAEVEALQKKWKKLRKKSITAAFDDRSVYNLSSIVVLCEFKSKRVLLTGDARGDKILKGLETMKLLKNGKIHVDLLKIPHHGSQHNSTKKFFQQVTAGVYVVSGDNVKFPNPHKKAMQWLADARGDDDYAIYCTYPLSYMSKIFRDKLRVPKNDQTSIVAAL